MASCDVGRKRMLIKAEHLRGLLMSLSLYLFTITIGMELIYVYYFVYHYEITNS